MATGDATGIVTSMLGSIGTVLSSGIGIVLTTVAVLIGLFFVIRLIQRKIGTGK